MSYKIDQDMNGEWRPLLGVDSKNCFIARVGVRWSLQAALRQIAEIDSFLAISVIECMFLE